MEANPCRCGKPGPPMQISSVTASTATYTTNTPKVYTVAAALAALKGNSRLKVSIQDTAANITANLKTLSEVQSQITQINLSSASDKVNLNATQFSTYPSLVGKLNDNTLVLTDSFAALNPNISLMRSNQAKISKIVLTPSADPNAKLTISPWDSQLWSKSVNGKFQIQTQINSTPTGSPTGPGTTTQTSQTVTVVPAGGIAKFTSFEDTQALASNYQGLKALDDLGMLAGIESFKDSAITTTIAQGKALNDLFSKYNTEFYLNIKDTSTNISKNIDFITNLNPKLVSITQIGDIRPLEMSRTQNVKADKVLAKMKNPYSVKFTGISSQYLSGDSTSQTFKLPSNYTSLTPVLVFINNTKQALDTYSVSDGKIVFKKPPPTGKDNIQVVLGEY